jgi:hypothetical protein
MPSTAADLIDKINATTRRLDALTDHASERSRRERAQWRNDDREAESWRRDQMRKDAENCRKHQARFDEVFRAHGQETPAPLGDEAPGDYRRRLLQNLIDSKLPRGDRWRGARADEFDTETIKASEPQILEAATREGENPTDLEEGELVRRDSIDPDTGARTVRWLGKTSFIKGFVRPGLRVRDFLARDGVNRVTLDGRIVRPEAR